jgi:hypothetical protein
MPFGALSRPPAGEGEPALRSALDRQIQVATHDVLRELKRITFAMEIGIPVDGAALVAVADRIASLRGRCDFASIVAPRTQD